MLEDNCAALDQISNTRQVEGNALINEVINHLVRPKDQQTLSGLVNFYYVFNCWNFLYQTMAPNICRSAAFLFTYRFRNCTCRLRHNKKSVQSAQQQKQTVALVESKCLLCFSTIWNSLKTLSKTSKIVRDSSVAVYSCQTALALRVRTLNVGTVRSAAVERLTLSLQQKATKFCIQSERLN